MVTTISLVTLCHHSKLLQYCRLHPPYWTSVQFSSVSQSCPTLCDPMNRSTPGLPVHHQLPEFTQTHVHRVSDALQPSHPLSSPSPPAPNPSQHQGLFQWVSSSHEMAKVLEIQLQRQYCTSHPLSGVLYNTGTSVSLTYSTHSPTPPSCSHQGIPCIWDYLCLIKFVHFSWFLDFTYKWCQVVFVTLWLISPSRFIHVSQTAKFHFYDWVIFHCVCVCVYLQMICLIRG